MDGFFYVQSVEDRDFVLAWLKMNSTLLYINVYYIL